MRKKKTTEPKPPPARELRASLQQKKSERGKRFLERVAASIRQIEEEERCLLIHGVTIRVDGRVLPAFSARVLDAED